MSNIDWDFIGGLEGKGKTKGYVPDAENSQSGVTIATGFDLGARNVNDLAGLPQDLIDKLTPFLGFKGAEADDMASDLVITNDEAKIIDEFSKKDSVDRLKSKWQAATGQSFDELPMNEATVIASVAFQYGDLESRTPNFWKQVTSGDWEAAEANLRNFGDNYGTRRVKEADYYQKKRLEPVYDDEIMRRQRAGEVYAEPIIEDSVDIPPIEPEVPVARKQPQRIEPLEVESDNFFIRNIRRAEQAEKIIIDESKLPPSPEDVRVQAAQADRDMAGPVSETIRKEQFGIAAPALFTDTSSEIWGAAFRQENPVYALSQLINDTLEAQGVDDTPGYDPFADPQLKGYEKSMWRFYDSGSENETFRRLKKYNQEVEDQMVLSASQSAAPLVAGLASPTTLLPVAPLRAMRATSVPKRFMGGAALTGGAIGTEEAIMQFQQETRDPSRFLMATGAAALIGGGINAAFGKRIAGGVSQAEARREAKQEAMFGEGGYYDAVGAGVSREKALETARATIEREALVETGVGIEKIPMNPVLRMAKSKNPIVRGLAPQMVDMGGVMQKKVGDEIAMEQPVEKQFAVNYLPGLISSLRSVEESFLTYRGIAASTNDIVRPYQILKQGARDRFTRTEEFITYPEFRERVGKAMRRGDKDAIDDAATPYVNQAAVEARKHLDNLKRNAEEVRLFDEPILRALAKAKATENEKLVRKLERRLEKIRSEGVTTNTAESYLPRVYRHDRIMADVTGFKYILREHAMNRLGMSFDEAVEYQDMMFDRITRAKPYLPLDDGLDHFDDIIFASGSRARELDIPDEVLEKFLESDVEVLLRHHTKQLGMDIEITRAFGSVDMKSVIDDITEEYASMGPGFEKQMEADLRDVRGLRDRLRGTYGASKDPHQLSSRVTRATKSFNVIVGMGGAMVSSLPDVARPIMVEGFKTFWEKGIRWHFRENAKILRKMAKKEMGMAAVAVDASLGLRAASFADMGDVFGNRFGFENFMSKSTSVMMYINGLNVWNQIGKEFSGNMTMFRMTDAIMQPWNRLSKADKEKLLKNGIDQQMASRMAVQIRQHGEQIDGYWAPNTDFWTDAPARQSFRIALNQNVDRIIITPGAGDRALWTSTEFGSLVTQFKGFGQGATIRMLLAGLQERDGAFLQGALAILVLAHLVNEIKRKQYGIDTKETFDQKLINAVERSGMLGWFMDVNNAVEKVTNYGVGLRPALTDEDNKPIPMGAKAGAVFGPAAQNLINFGDIATDVLGGNADYRTLQSARFLTPFANLPYADPAFDYIFGSNVNRQSLSNDR